MMNLRFYYIRTQQNSFSTAEIVLTLSLFPCLLAYHLTSYKPITLLLESVAAKDMSCLIAGYCRLFVDPNLNIFPWIEDSKKHRVSAEEGAEKNSHIQYTQS